MPIVVGYIFAHYLTYLVEKGQAVVYTLAGIDADVAFVLSTHTTTLAALKVSFVVAGHVLAVVAAHDRALIVLPRAHRLSGQMGMLLLMVDVHVHRAVPAVLRVSARTPLRVID